MGLFIASLVTGLVIIIIGDKLASPRRRRRKPGVLKRWGSKRSRGYREDRAFEEAKKRIWDDIMAVLEREKEERDN